jgi:hypothetical protein
MWRWVIRIYVAFTVFGVLMFLSTLMLVQVDRSLVRSGYLGLSHAVHQHPLLALLLMGFAAGQLYLGSNFTGHGWFRSKTGLTYEGFKLEELKPWSWAIVSPVLLAGIFLWFGMQEEAGTFADISWASFNRSFLMPDCSNRRFFGVGGDMACSLNLMFLGTWVASIGYSLAPVCRKRAWKLLPKISYGGSFQGLMKRRATKEQ